MLTMSNALHWLWTHFTGMWTLFISLWTQFIAMWMRFAGLWMHCTFIDLKMHFFCCVVKIYPWLMGFVVDKHLDACECTCYVMSIFKYIYGLWFFMLTMSVKWLHWPVNALHYHVNTLHCPMNALHWSVNATYWHVNTVHIQRPMNVLPFLFLC